MKIRLLKKSRQSPNSLGCVNSKWLNEHYMVTFAGRPFLDINDGDVQTKDYEPVPATEILAELIKQNWQTNKTDATGSFTKTQFNTKWEVDYQPELKEFFEKYKIPIPADGRSQGDRLKESMLKSLEMQGLITTGIATTDSSAGQKMIYQAKIDAEEKELLKLQEQKAALVAEMEALKTKKPKAEKEAKEPKAEKEAKEPAVV